MYIKSDSTSIEIVNYIRMWPTYPLIRSILFNLLMFAKENVESLIITVQICLVLLCIAITPAYETEKLSAYFWD